MKIPKIGFNFVLMSALIGFAPGLSAQSFTAPGGIGLQVNEGDAVPPAQLLAAATNPGDDVRDILGWPESEQSPGAYALPARNAALYSEVAQAGRSNVVTLFGCDTLAAYACSGPQSFPQTPAQIAGFTNWACWVVGAANIPNLRAVTIWNEMNGSFNGGIGTPAAQQLAMAKLLAAVVPAIRECNPNVAIYAGAFVGDVLLADWFCKIQKFGFNWSQVDGLDIHPYLSGAPSMPAQSGLNWYNAFLGSNSLVNGCAGGSAPIVAPLYFSEWGGAALQNALSNGYFPTAAAYFAWFEKTVANVSPVKYPVAGRAFFLLANDSNFPTQGVFSADYSQTTPIGNDYLAAYVAP
jgi:hypothetical protein